MNLIDLSHELSQLTRAHPYDEPPRLFQDRFLEKDKFNSYRAEFGTHLGTHIDAPSHLTEIQKFISDYPIDRFVGTCRVIDARGEDRILWKNEYRDYLEGCAMVFICTGWSDKFGTDSYFEGHPDIDLGFAEHLLDTKVGLVGIDTPSPDRYPFPVHQILLKNDVLILENLTNLDRITGKAVRVYAFPLNLRTDAAWVRVVAEYD